MKRILCFALLGCMAPVASPQIKPVGRPAITGIAGIGLRAQSLSADRNFYEHTLGWTAVPSVEASGGLRFHGESSQRGEPTQWVEVVPATSPSQLPFHDVAFATTNANTMRIYLAQHGVAVPASITRRKDGSRSFGVKDPEGNIVEFIQRGPLPAHPSSDPQAISSRIIHAGFLVHNASREDGFYRKILGFRLYWKGGMKDGVTDFFSLQVPDGTDWIEYMLNVPANPSHRELGIVDHFSLGVVKMDTVVARLSERGWKPSSGSHKQMGRDGKYQLNVYDPDGVRVEFMEFRPVQEPCCSPFMGPHPKPSE